MPADVGPTTRSSQQEPSATTATARSLVLLLCIASASPLTACASAGSGTTPARVARSTAAPPETSPAHQACTTEFASSLDGSTPGASSPTAAITSWVTARATVPVRPAPATGWRQVDASPDGSVRHFSHGGWRLEVTSPAAGGWFVTAGTTC